jgi:anti-sigma B factor antagonist
MEFGAMTKAAHPVLLTETVGDVTVIRFAQPTLLAAESVREIAERLCDLAERPVPTKLVLDFHVVHSMSGQMLAVLVWIARKIERGGGGVKLCGVTPHILDHFEITRLYRHFEIYREPSNALEAFARQGRGVYVS